MPDNFTHQGESAGAQWVDIKQGQIQSDKGHEGSIFREISADIFGGCTLAPSPPENLLRLLKFL
jgi:hypothetical protein